MIFDAELEPQESGGFASNFKLRPSDVIDKSVEAPKPVATMQEASGSRIDVLALIRTISTAGIL